LSRDWAITDLSLDARGSRFRLRDQEIVCPLAGEHQVENARTAAIALHELGSPAAGIAATSWPGRLERVSERPEIILDGAHNPAGTRALARYIQRFYSGRRIWIVYGVMRDKDVADMAGLLFPLAGRVILTAPDNSRAMPPEQIPAADAVITHTVAEAVAMLRQAEPDDVVFITGSLFVVGEARALLTRRRATSL
jgi:dihydrofolate synthase/folylpolyglutamate synthase